MEPEAFANLDPTVAISNAGNDCSNVQGIRIWLSEYHKKFLSVVEHLNYALQYLGQNRVQTVCA